VTPSTNSDSCDWSDQFLELYLSLTGQN
jgi:hypothetical protein